MTYNFEKYARDTSRHYLPRHTYDGIRLRKQGIWLCHSVRERFGDSRVSIFFDKDAGCFLLKPDPEGYRITKAHHTTGLICATRLSDTMPLGRYLYTGEHDGGYLFTYQQ